MSLESLLNPKNVKRFANNTIKIGLAATLLSLSACGKKEGTTQPPTSNNPPDTWIIEGPSGTISDSTATFTWDGSDKDGSVDSFIHSLNGHNITVPVTTKQVTFTRLRDGDHNFSVKAVDDKGLEDPTPATRNFNISFIQEDPIHPESRFIYASTGGTVSSGGYEVVIPPGALVRDTNLTIATQHEVNEITTDSAERVTPAMKITLNSSLRDSIKIRFPEQALTEGLVGIVDSDNKYSLGKLSLNGGKIEFGYFRDTLLRPSQPLEPQDAVDMIAFLLSFPKQTQPVVLNTRGVNLSSSEKVALLIHGLGSMPEVFNDALLPLLDELYHNRVMTFQYPSGLSISTNGSNLEREINNLGRIPFKFDIVSHSMGGLVARSFARNNPDAVDKLVTLGSPHEGALNPIMTQYVEMLLNLRLMGIFNPYSTGARDAITGSTFLANLNSPGAVNAHYFLVSGNLEDLLSPIIPGEDDGLISVKSAELGDRTGSLGSSLYPNPESVLSWERNRLSSTHQELKSKQIVMDKIRDILEERPPEEQTIVLQPGPEGIDTFVWNIHPDTNYGNSELLWAATHSGSPHYRSLIKFDLSSIPPRSDIISANLYLYGRAVRFEGDGPSTVSLHMINSAWNENSVTWNNQPSYNETSITARGIPESSHDEWHTFTVKTAVENWVEESIQNNGFLMRQQYENWTRTFNCRSSDGSSSKRPKLEVTYITP